MLHTYTLHYVVFVKSIFGVLKNLYILVGISEISVINGPKYNEMDAKN